MTGIFWLVHHKQTFKYQDDDLTLLAISKIQNICASGVLVQDFPRVIFSWRFLSAIHIYPLCAFVSWFSRTHNLKTSFISNCYWILTASSLTYMMQGYMFILLALPYYFINPWNSDFRQQMCRPTPTRYFLLILDTVCPRTVPKYVAQHVLQSCTLVPCSHLTSESLFFHLNLPFFKSTCSWHFKIDS